jgi:hypothetical protein
MARRARADCESLASPDSFNPQAQPELDAFAAGNVTGTNRGLLAASLAARYAAAFGHAQLISLP